MTDIDGKADSQIETGRRQGSWLTDVACFLSESEELMFNATRYRLPFSRIENPPEWQRAEIVATKFTGGTPSQWAIREMQMVMTKDGEWEWEPSPSNRDDDFLARTRFDTVKDAAECALKFSSANAKNQTPPPLGASSCSPSVAATHYT